MSQATLGLQLGAAAVAALSVGIKEALYRQTLTVATEVRSSTLAANAWHHRSDALSSVVALVGIGGAAAWSKRPLGSTRGRLLRLLGARLAALGGSSQPPPQPLIPPPLTMQARRAASPCSTLWRGCSS